MPDNTYLIVCSNTNNPKKILEAYRQRWNIEVGFKNMKRHGFNIENTHMTSQNRLLKLMAAIAVAMLFACLVGVYQKCPFKKTVNAPLYSLFTIGFRTLKQKLKSRNFQKIIHNPSLI